MEISSVHHQAMATHLDEALNCPKSQQQQQQQEQKKARPQPEQALKCPRCDSTNTKFCYYNNYSLSQPRYFCKGCRRYWTKGGSLRNVPVGGGCRKNHKRSSNPSSSSSSNSSSSKKSNDPDHLAAAAPNPTPLLPPLPLPPLSFDPADLTLAFASDSFMLSNTTPGTSASVSGFLDILRGGGGSNNNNLSSYYGFGGIDRNMDQVETGAVANTNAGTVDAGAGLMMFPNFDGGLLSGTASRSSACTESVTATTEMDHSGAINVDVEGDNSNSNKVVMGMGLHQWPVVDYGNLGLDSARDAHYWNGVGAAAAPWHGLINSSLM